jgi:threonine/homoserine/homoserine lactone efflux protein
MTWLMYLIAFLLLFLGILSLRSVYRVKSPDENMRENVSQKSLWIKERERRYRIVVGIGLIIISVIIFLK